MFQNITPEQLEKRKKINSKILKFGCLPIVIIFTIISIIGLLHDHDAMTKVDSQVEPENLSAMAYMQSQEFVKQSLNYPDTASFDYKFTE